MPAPEKSTSITIPPAVIKPDKYGPAIRVENIAKEYVIGRREQSVQTFREMVTSVISAPLNRLRRLRGEVSEEEKIWALKDISFEVQPGEVIGVIGRNGAGKSTLLKILSRITSPTRGRIELKGRVGSLLEVGTGFHPELTGRENIYLNGAILGMSKREIEGKFDEIVAFAEIEQFLDTPVKRYSSGMYVRLAFSVAAHLEPEILLVDEVLAVGDIAFQKKCLGKMENVSKQGRTVLLVSHQMQAVHAITERSVVIEGGKVSYIGETSEAIKEYQSFLGKNKDVSDQRRTGPNTEIYISSIKYRDKNNDLVSKIKRGEQLLVDLTVICRKNISDADIAISVRSSDGLEIFSDSWTDHFEALSLSVGRHVIKIDIPTSYLKIGQYWMTVCITKYGREIRDMVRGIEMPSVDLGLKDDPEKESHRWGVVRLPVTWEKDNDV